MPESEFDSVVRGVEGLSFGYSYHTRSYCIWTATSYRGNKLSLWSGDLSRKSLAAAARSVTAYELGLVQGLIISARDAK